jgi:hypothetical protein
VWLSVHTVQCQIWTSTSSLGQQHISCGQARQCMHMHAVGSTVVKAGQSVLQLQLQLQTASVLQHCLCV